MKNITPGPNRRPLFLHLASIDKKIPFTCTIELIKSESERDSFPNPTTYITSVPPHTLVGISKAPTEYK